MSKARHMTGKAPSQRQLRVGELIRRALSDVFSRGDLHDPDLAGVSITVGEVRLSPDLKHASVFVLPLGGKDSDIVLDALNAKRRQIRREMNRQVTLKFSPELRFLADESFDQMDETRRLLAEPSVSRDLKD